MYTLIEDLIYNITLLVYPNPLGVSVNVTCIAVYQGVKYSNTVILQGILSLFSINDLIMYSSQWSSTECESIYIK